MLSCDSEPSKLILSTEIWLLAASTASRYRPLPVIWIAPCDAKPLPFPAPPALNGDPASGVSDPSAWRLNAPIVFVPAVLSLTYTCPTTREKVGAAEAVAGTATATVPRRPSRRVLRHVLLSKRAKTRIAYLLWVGLPLATGPR